MPSLLRVQYLGSILIFPSSPNYLDSWTEGYSAAPERNEGV